MENNYYPSYTDEKTETGGWVMSQGYPAGIEGRIPTQTDQRSSVVCQSSTVTITLHKQPHGLSGLSQEAFRWLTSVQGSTDLDWAPSCQGIDWL